LEKSVHISKTFAVEESPATTSSTSSPTFFELSEDELDSVDEKSPLIQEESVIRRRNNVARKVGVGLDKEREGTTIY
jgi:hypothetical protein